MTAPATARAPAQALPELHEARIAAAMARARKPFDPSAGGSREIVIFGSGELGRRILASARAAGLDVCAVADNNERRWGSDLDGVRVVGAAEAIARFGATAVFVIAVFNPNAVLAQLRGAGAGRVVTYPTFFWNFAPLFHGLTGLALPSALLARRSEIHAALAYLDDPASRREYAAQIAWRCSLDDSLLEAPSRFADMHFDRSVYALGENETLVDCGAFDGDSLRAFVTCTDGAFRHIYALEPDPANRGKLERFVAELAPAARAAVTVLPFAAGDRNGAVRFDAGNGVASSSSESGAVEVPCRRLDDAIPGAATLIKMDIEGAEPLALRGAARLIREQRPVLAVCAYHHCEHLWELPQLLRELAPDFRIFLRRYAEQCWETVYYAVPPERCAAS